MMFLFLFLFTKTVYPKLHIFSIFTPVKGMKGYTEHVDTRTFEISIENDFYETGQRLYMMIRVVSFS